MSEILKLFLTDDAYAKVKRNYVYFRQQNISMFTLLSSIFFTILGSLVFRFESPSWQRLLSEHHYWFPHISRKYPRFGDVFRYLLQGIWLILIYPKGEKRNFYNPNNFFRRILNAYYTWLEKLPSKIKNNKASRAFSSHYAQKNGIMRHIIFSFLIVIAIFLLLICITQPFQPTAQFIFVIILWCMAMSIRKIPGQVSTIMLIILSIIVSSRYLWWRFGYTLVWDNTESAVFGILLILAETYVCLVMVLGYFQTIWPLHREPVPLPEDQSTWPTVDILFTTYNEDLNILKPGIYSALGLDWPKEKLNIYISDDGNRPEFKAFADEVGVHYLARPTKDHAKAGNMNYAIKHTKSDLIAIFDCDFVVTQPFLQLTVGWFLKNPNLAILQTPHHFFSPDPFERNLKSFRQTPNENALFYGVVQNGNDTWNAAYFCGSAGIMRRTALERIGGMAVDTVTEDAYTSLKLQRLGYDSAYIQIPMAAGLATDTLTGYLGQHIRWARGMVQILRINNPLFGKGLTLGQRLCYFNAMLHFLSGIPRLIFFITPAAFLILNAYILYAPGIMILLYAIPHIVLATIANNRIQGKYRHYLWNEIYDTVMAWYIAIPTTMALINPRQGKFNVTPKGDLIEEEHVDWSTARPYMILLCINIAGLMIAGFRLASAPTEVMIAILITTAWALYNVAILGGALGVTIEAQQRRKAPRVSFEMPARIMRADGKIFECSVKDYSYKGVGLHVEQNEMFTLGEEISLLLKYEQTEYTFPCTIAYSFQQHVGIRLQELSLKQNIDFIKCTFARPDIWTLWQEAIPEDKPFESIKEIFSLTLRSYLEIAEHVPPKILKTLKGVYKTFVWLGSFIPRRPKLQERGFKRLSLLEEK